MLRDAPPFRADHVGSLLRPKALLKAREDHAAGTVSGEQLRELEDATITDVIALQREAGLRSATDGELDFTPAALPVDGKLVVLGIVTTKHGELESKDALKARVDDASKYVDLDQICISPQCGFSSTSEGNSLGVDQEKAKPALLVELADEVWG